MNKPLTYAVVIATMNRTGFLRRAVETLLAQSRPPALTVIVDSSTNAETSSWFDGLPSKEGLIYLPFNVSSAAHQRNLGARKVNTDLIAFIDDDVELPNSLMTQLIAPFESVDGLSLGGVAGRIAGLQHRRPSPLLRGIYRLMAGYSDPHYGARLFGPALNTLPCYYEQTGLIRSEWLNSTCVVYRNELFQRERFPEFDGYSYLEDVHLSARIGKTHRLCFHAEASYTHHCAVSPFKKDRAKLAAMAMRHRRAVAREVMGLGKWTIAWKQLIHRLLNSAVLLKMRPDGWIREGLGTWSS